MDFVFLKRKKYLYEYKEGKKIVILQSIGIIFRAAEWVGQGGGGNWGI